MRMPASVAYSVPPATAPRVPRDARRTGRSCRGGCCPRTTAASIATETASLSFIWKPLYEIATRRGAGRVLNRFGGNDERGAYPVGQTLGQTANFRQTAPEIHVSPGFAAHSYPAPPKRLSTRGV